MKQTICNITIFIDLVLSFYDLFWRLDLELWVSVEVVIIKMSEFMLRFASSASLTREGRVSEIYVVTTTFKQIPWKGSEHDSEIKFQSSSEYFRRIS